MNTTPAQRIQLDPGISINGVRFGCGQHELFEVLGEPARLRQQPGGDVELIYRTNDSEQIFRCYHHRFVESTFADPGPVDINGVTVLDTFSWLARQPDCVEAAGFRISPAAALAYDARDLQNGSITAFARGYWDQIINQIGSA